MVWEFAILGGMYDGRNLVKMSCPLGRPHDSEDWKAAQAKWSRTDLYRILGRVPAINELLDPETQQTGPVVMDIVGAVAEVELHWKDGNNGQRYANCRINDLVRSPEKEGLRTQLPLMDAVKAVNRELREAAEEGSIDLVVAFTDADLRERKRWLSQGLDVDVLLVAPERDRDRGDHWDDGLFQLRSEPLGRAFRRLDVLFSGPAGRGLHSPSELESSLRRVVAMEELYLLRRSDLSLAEAEGAPEGGTALPPGMDGQPRIDRSRDPESLRGAMASAKASRRKALGPLRGAKTRGHLAVAGRWTIREGLVPDPKIEAAIASHQEDRMAQLKVLVAEPAGGAAIEQPFGSQDQCIDCHAPLLASWARSPHAQAWLHLRERGETRNPDCLPCHTTGFGQVGGFVDPAADRTLLNVQCEACHGPMELHALKAAHPGVRPPAGSPVTSKTCEGCHDKANSPNFDCRSYLRMLPHPVLGPGWEETAAEVCGP